METVHTAKKPQIKKGTVGIQREKQRGKRERVAEKSRVESRKSTMAKGWIAPRQIAFLFAAFLPLSKTIFLPSLFSAYAGHALLYPVIFLFATDAISLLLVLILAKKGEGFPTVLYRAFGRAGGKVVLLLLAATFFIQTYLPIGEERLFIQLGLYARSPSLFYVLPLFVFAYFLFQKSPTVIGRAADLLVFFTMAAFLSLFFFSLPSANFARLMPLFPDRGTDVFLAVKKGVPYFGEGLYPLLFLGKFSAGGRDKRKIYRGFLTGAGLTVCFFAVFYAVFGALAPDVQFGVPNVAKHNLSVLEIGRVDYFSVFGMLAVSCVGLLLPAYFSACCLQFLFGKEEDGDEGGVIALFSARCENDKNSECLAGRKSGEKSGRNSTGKGGRTGGRARRFLAKNRTRIVAALTAIALLFSVAFTQNRFAETSERVRNWFFPAAAVCRLLLPAFLCLFPDGIKGKTKKQKAETPHEGAGG